MTCNDKCIHFPVCEQKKYDFANIDECVYYQEERPTGEWIFDKAASQYKCSNCGLFRPPVNDYYLKKIIGCPYCLAKMKGGGE